MERHRGLKVWSPPARCAMLKRQPARFGVLNIAKPGLSQLVAMHALPSKEGLWHAIVEASCCRPESPTGSAEARSALPVPGLQIETTRF